MINDNDTNDDDNGDEHDDENDKHDDENNIMIAVVINIITNIWIK